ncbi:MAG: TIGR03118 family protein [Terriglobia bacterium]
MEPRRFKPCSTSVLISLLGAFLLPLLLNAQNYFQTNLVSNSSAIPAAHIDPNLVNPWGMVQTGTSPFWVSDQVTNKSTLYMGTGAAVPLVVNIPPTSGSPNGPTGVVANTGTGFPLPAASGSGTVSSRFIFDNLNGQLYGWNPMSTGGTANAVVTVTTPGAAYTGLAINGTGSLLYAADFTPAGGVDVLNSQWQSQGKLPALPSNISLPSNYQPYNVADINGTLFMAYDPLLTSGPLAGKLPELGDGNGAVIKFDPTTMTYSELVAPGVGDGLNVPWGFAMAPSDFGKFSGDLLVGEFGNGWISAYNPTNGNFDGYLTDDSGMPIADGGLWTIVFGSGNAGTQTNALYITAGITQPFQTEGLLAEIQATPEPATLALFGSGLLVLGLMIYRRRRIEE